MSRLSLRATVLRPNRPFVVAAFTLTAVVTVWLFVPTMFGHIAVMNSDAVEVSATDYAVSDDGEQLLVTFEVNNPTRRSIKLYNGLLYPRAADGTRLSDGTTSPLETVTVVPSGETKTVTVVIGVRKGAGDRVRNAIESGSITLSGKLNGRISDAEVEIPVQEAESN